MALYAYMLLLLIPKYTIAEKCVIDNTPEYVTWVNKLKEELNCGHSYYHAPSENTIVNVTYIMEDFNFDTEQEVMSLQSSMIAMWKDERLKWDPEKHHGINKIDISNIHIWSPMFGLSNVEEHKVYFSLYGYDIKSTGEVYSRIRMHELTQCSIKLTDWPYDVQECNFTYTQKESSSRTGDFTLNFNFFVRYLERAEWSVYDYREVRENNTKNQVKLIFSLKREAVGLSAIVISPAFVLTVLSILSLFLDVRCKVRLAIICFSLLGHYYFLKELSYDIPKESNFPSTLLLYYRGSVVLSVIIILSSLFLAAICKLRSTPHNFVKQINDFVYENKYTKYLVYPRWDIDDSAVDSKPNNEDWVKFANIVNSVLIFVIVIAYIGLYGTKIPKETSNNKNYFE